MPNQEEFAILPAAQQRRLWGLSCAWDAVFQPLLKEVSKLDYGCCSVTYLGAVCAQGGPEACGGCDTKTGRCQGTATECSCPGRNRVKALKWRPGQQRIKTAARPPW